MKRLILMRHSKTEPWYAGSDDHGRALLPRGKADAVLVAAEIMRLGWAPDMALVSSARRTRETWLAMSDVLVPCEREIMDDLYLAGTRFLETAVETQANTPTLMLIGHNPGMHDFAAAISSRAGARKHSAAMALAAKMPTSAAALFETSEETDGVDLSVFRLIDYVLAKPLRADEGGEFAR